MLVDGAELEEHERTEVGGVGVVLVQGQGLFDVFQSLAQPLALESIAPEVVFREGSLLAAGDGTLTGGAAR
ncbi:MAG: hypothetical protein U0359_10170 [Byssovorax sp.]